MPSFGPSCWQYPCVKRPLCHQWCDSLATSLRLVVVVRRGFARSLRIVTIFLFSCTAARLLPAGHPHHHFNTAGARLGGRSMQSASMGPRNTPAPGATLVALCSSWTPPESLGACRTCGSGARWTGRRGERCRTLAAAARQPGLTRLAARVLGVRSADERVFCGSTEVCSIKMQD